MHFKRLEIVSSLWVERKILGPLIGFEGRLQNLFSKLHLSYHEE